MEAKEMLKHQVRLVKQMNPNNSDRLPSAQSSKMAKQVLRALAVWNWKWLMGRCSHFLCGRLDP